MNLQASAKILRVFQLRYLAAQPIQIFLKENPLLSLNYIFSQNCRQPRVKANGRSIMITSDPYQLKWKPSEMIWHAIAQLLTLPITIGVRQIGKESELPSTLSLAERPLLQRSLPMLSEFITGQVRKRAVFQIGEKCSDSRANSGQNVPILETEVYLAALEIRARAHKKTPTKRFQYCTAAS